MLSNFANCTKSVFYGKGVVCVAFLYQHVLWVALSCDTFACWTTVFWFWGGNIHDENVAGNKHKSWKFCCERHIDLFKKLFLHYHFCLVIIDRNKSVCCLNWTQSLCVSFFGRKTAVVDCGTSEEKQHRLVKKTCTLRIVLESTASLTCSHICAVYWLTLDSR